MSTLHMVDVVHNVAVFVCGRYGLWPVST